MTEEDAQNWIKTHFDVSRGTWERLEAFIAFLKNEAQRQNLVSAASLDHMWARHIADSAQLLRFVSPKTSTWIDLGSGAGFPGLIVAILSDWRVTLVESRAKRIEFLNRAIEQLGLGDQARVAGMPVERLDTSPYGVISARAFAPLDRLLPLASRFSTPKTIWLLPKGQNAANELADARNDWNFDMRVEPSITQADAGILVGRVLGTARKAAAKGWRK